MHRHLRAAKSVCQTPGKWAAHPGEAKNGLGPLSEGPCLVMAVARNEARTKQLISFDDAYLTEYIVM